MNDLGRISAKYQFSIGCAPDAVPSYELALETADQMGLKEELTIPISIFRCGLSSLQAIVVYLKDMMQLRYCEIAILLNRDQRTVWVTYSEAKKILTKPLETAPSELDLTSSIFQDRKLSVLEHIVRHLRNKGIRFNRIGQLLELDQRTIWTVAHRAGKKIKNEL